MQNNGKRSELEKSLAQIKQQLQDMKEEDPDGDFSSVEKMILVLSNMLAQLDERHHFWKALFRKTLFLLLEFVLLMLGCLVSCGFAFPFAVSSVSSFFYLIASIAGILFLIFKIPEALFGLIPTKHPFLNTMITQLFGLALLIVLDDTVFHRTTGMFETLLYLAIVLILFVLLEYYLYRKWFRF